MSEAPAPRKRLKWEPVVAMIGLIFVGIWLVVARPGMGPGAEAREGARVVKMLIGQSRGLVEVVGEGDDATFRVLDGAHASEVMDRAAFEALFGPSATEAVVGGSNLFYRALNITGLGSLIWVGIGLLGQIVFSCRFLVQWLVSERERRSVIPEVFWWISLFGGVCLFVYFVWRQDLVGVLGQSSGVVIYARNLRLIAKERRRKRREEIAPG